MKAGKTVREIMNVKGYTYKAIADKLNRSTTSAISNPVFRENGMRVESLLEILNAMDCELVVRSKLKDKKEWTIDLGSSRK